MLVTIKTSISSRRFIAVGHDRREYIDSFNAHILFIVGSNH